LLRNSNFSYLNREFDITKPTISDQPVNISKNFTIKNFFLKELSTLFDYWNESGLNDSDRNNENETQGEGEYIIFMRII